MTTKRTAKKDSLWTSAAARRLLKLAGDPPTVEEAVRVVVGRLLEGIPHPPTDLEALKPSLNLTGFYAEDMPISGELRRDGRGFKVIYSAYLSPERRRFTIAHEIGHAIFEKSGPNCPRVGSELERLCDMLAAEILMPRDIFLQKAGDEPSVQKVLELAKLFGTSLSATALRYGELRRVTVFNVQDDAVTWGYGIVKKGLLKAKDYGIRDAIENSQSNGSGQLIVYLNNPKWVGLWKLEWIRLGSPKNAIFLLQPVYSPQIKSK
jgi:hypothetical protein